MPLCGPIFTLMYNNAEEGRKNIIMQVVMRLLEISVIKTSFYQRKRIPSHLTFPSVCFKPILVRLYMYFYLHQFLLPASIPLYEWMWFELDLFRFYSHVAKRDPHKRRPEENINKFEEKEYILYTWTKATWVQKALVRHIHNHEHIQVGFFII